MPGTCDAAGCANPPAYHERLEYVSLNQRERLRTTSMRRVCRDHAEAISNAMPHGGSMPAVVAALVDYAFDQTPEHWAVVERAIGPFVAMGKQEPLFV